MRRLGGMDLPHGIQWLDRFAASSIVQSVEYTLSGKPVLWARDQTSRPITLEADPVYCMITAAGAAALQAMADQPGAIYRFEWDDYSCRVVFACHESPAVDLTFAYNPGAGIYQGRVKLMRYRHGH